MTDDADPLADRPGDIAVESDETVYRGFRALIDMRFRYAGRFGDRVTATVSREIADIGTIAAVLPFDPVLDRFVLLRQFRVGAHMASGRGDMIEIVAGLIDPGESAETAARRETKEEAGVEVLDLIEAYRFMPSPGFTTEYATLFCARVDASDVPPMTGELDEGEVIETIVVSPADAIAALDAGRLTNCYTAQALLWFARHEERVRDIWRG